MPVVLNHEFMNITNPYLRLMRLHQSVGIWLLFWPCAWSLLVAANGSVLFIAEKLLLFFVGAVLMRSAGCIINDIVDREIDKQVERTKTRPLASGEVTLTGALISLLILLLLSLAVALLLGLQVTMWAALSLFPVAIYPFMKRVSWWPQLFLGMVFNWGALMGWVAVRGQIELPALWLYIAGICLTIGYDTIYAHQDKIDDARIGVRSTALRLGSKTRIFVAVMYALATIFFMLASGNLWSVLYFAPVVFHCLWQLHILEIDKPDSAKAVFLSNSYLELIIFFSLFFSLL